MDDLNQVEIDLSQEHVVARTTAKIFKMTIAYMRKYLRSDCDVRASLLEILTNALINQL